MSSPNLTNLVLFSPIWEESPNPKFRISVSVNSSTNVQITVSRAVVRGLNINIPFMKHTGTWIMDEKINILSHHVFFIYFYNIHQHTLYLFNDHPPHSAWFAFHSAPRCRPVCGGNSWQYWHQSWMHFTNNCLCKTSIYIMNHVVCRYPYSIDLEMNKVKTIPTPGARSCGWPPTLASVDVKAINKVSQKIMS